MSACRAAVCHSMHRARTVCMASTNLLQDKKALRSTLKSALKQADDADLGEQSRTIQETLLRQSWFAAAKTVGVYLHCARLREVDTSLIVAEALKQGKRCYVPLVQDNDSNMALLHLDSLQGLQSVPPFGILEPSTTYADGQPRQNILDSGSPAMDLLVMPGLGFDPLGSRLGRGGGYYDKFLAQVTQHCEAKSWQPPLVVALAFRQQLVQEVPMGPQDRSLDAIVTADQLMLCTDKARALA